MKKRRIFIITSILVVLSLLGWNFFSPREMLYEGQPTSYWIHCLAVGDNKGLYELVDSNAIPILVQAMKMQDGLPRKTYRTARLDSPRWIRHYLPRPIDTSIVREDAVEVLDHMGDDAKPTIPILIQLLNEDESPNVRTSAAYLLGKFAADDKNIQQALTNALNDEDQEVRNTATNALQQINSTLTPTKKELK